MTRLEKLIQRIKARPPEARFKDVERLFLAFGWEKREASGSHVSFKKKGEGRITIPLVSGRRVERVYLDQISERLGLDDDDN